MRNPVGLRMLDGLGNGLGYSLILIIVGVDPRASGPRHACLGCTVLPTAADGGWFQPLA